MICREKLKRTIQSLNGSGLNKKEKLFHYLPVHILVQQQ